MKYTLKGKQYQLKDNEVTFAKKIVNGFIKNARVKFADHSSLRAYLTFLIVMMAASQDCLEQYDNEDFDEVFK